MLDSQNTIILKNSEEIQLLYRANQIVAIVLDTLKKVIVPGVSTVKLDRLAEECCRDHGGIPAFKGYRGFPASLCTSINEEVVHGIPSLKKNLLDGDIISLDFGVLYNQFYGDAAITVPVGDISVDKFRLLEITRESLNKGIDQVKPGNRIGDISYAIQSHVEQAGFSVVREFVGHGIGKKLHEPPEIPNYFDKKSTPRILVGMILAIEPMVNMGKSQVITYQDKWTVATKDGKPSAHFEHSVAVTETGPLILSSL